MQTFNLKNRLDLLLSTNCIIIWVIARSDAKLLLTSLSKEVVYTVIGDRSWHDLPNGRSFNPCCSCKHVYGHYFAD